MNFSLESLKKLFDLPFFGKHGASALGVDVGSSTVKVVQLRRRGGVAELETYGELALGPYADLDVGLATQLPPPQISEALTDVMRESSVTTKAAGVSIPFTSSLVTLVDMPRVAPKELRKMIPLEARKYIPVPIAEVSLDWLVVPEHERVPPGHSEEEPKPQARTQEVLLVAIHNDVLKKYQQIVDAANLEPSFFEIEVFSAMRASLGNSLAPTVVLDMGAATTKLYVVELGVVKLSYLINRGGQDITQAISRSLGVSLTHAEEMKREQGLLAKDESLQEVILLILEHIFSEANRVLLSYQKRYNKNVRVAVLAGGGAVLKGLMPYAKKHLETEVELSDPFAKTEAPAFLEDVLKEIGPEFAVAIGLALRKLQEYD